MKKIWILATILLLILAACAAPKEEAKTPETAPVEKAPVTTETPPAAAPPETTPPAEVGRTPPPVETLPSERQTTPPTVIETKAEMSPQLRDLLKRADEKITSLQFLFGGTSTNNLFLDTYMIKDTKMKIKKYSEDYYVREDYYDTIYVDLSVGCCEELSRCKSANVDNTKKKFEVDTASLNIPKTPYEWVKEIPADAKITGPQTFNERSVTAIKFTKDGAEYEMIIDDTYGVPHRIIVTDGSGKVTKYQFNDLEFNNLKDDNFNAPCD